MLQRRYRRRPPAGCLGVSWAHAMRPFYERHPVKPLGRFSGWLSLIGPFLLPRFTESRGTLPAGCSPEDLAQEPKPRLQLVGRFHRGSRESLPRTTFYPCRSKSEHQILHTPDGDSETAGEEYPIYSDGELQELTRGAYGHLRPTSLHVFSSSSVPFSR